MSRKPIAGTHWRFWLGVAVLAGLALWQLNAILLPFIVGAVVAFIFDPVVARLQRHGLSRTWATALVTFLGALIAIGVVTAILPPLFNQVEELVTAAPQFVVRAVATIQPMIEPIGTRLGLPPLGLSDVQEYAKQWAGQILSIGGGVAGRLAQSGVAVIDLLGLLFLTPVVTFYLLRDWDKILVGIDGALPLEQAATIRTLARRSNAAVAGYLRGQALVCICLGTIYGVGLTVVGLKFGFVIGLMAGLISFIPFLGTLVGAATSLGMALAQFPPDWFGVLEVAIVFLVGHLLEANFLSPKLVGDRVGLHPVWIMFALLAGGALLGFAGVLVAVPVAAVAGVLVRHLIQRYRESELYRGDDPV
jgi:predicted PurR-regulated permease PerM